MARELVTRRVLARELVLNAATRPLNVGVPAAVAVAGLLLNTFWLLPVALIVYAAMLVATFFDAGEAARVGRVTYDRARSSRRPQLEASLFARPIAQKLELARAEEARIQEAAAKAPLGLGDLTAEVGRLMEELDKLARRAQWLYEYLDEQDEEAVRKRLRRLRETRGDTQVAAANDQAAAALEDQLAVGDELRRQLSQFDAQMEHITASLGAIHGQIVRASVTEEAAAQDGVAAGVRDLRREVRAAADAMRDAYSEVSDAGPTRPLPPPRE